MTISKNMNGATVVRSNGRSVVVTCSELQVRQIVRAGARGIEAAYIAQDRAEKAARIRACRAARRNASETYAAELMA